MNVGIFGGSFDPVHIEHVKLAKEAIEKLSLQKLFVVPSRVAPHKLFGSEAIGEDRENMCKIAFEGVSGAEVSDFELQSENTSYSYLTCRHFFEQYNSDKLFFLVGRDMLEDFFTWKRPEEIVKYAQIVSCGRGKPIDEELERRFFERFGKKVLPLNFVGDNVSSTEIRVFLAFGKQPKGLQEEVYSYIAEHGLYQREEILRALSLEKEERREHSFRVALLACSRAKSLKIPFSDALLAAALHDIGKNLENNSPLLKGFTPPFVPPPILHQYTGAYLAKEYFHVENEDVLNAICYHTSGRRGMSELEKLIYLADALEAGRSFEKIDYLRELFWRDLDLCLKEFFKEQIKYLKESGKPVYPLTLEANEWICEVISKKGGFA